MNDLIRDAIKAERKNLKIDVLCIFGESSPEIGKRHTYKWALKVTGNKNYRYIKELIIDINFYPEKENYLHIIECRPEDESIDVGTFSIQGPGGIGFNKPISIKKASCITKSTKASWIFNDINLNKNELFEETIKGELDVEFTSDSKYGEVGFGISIMPTFVKRKYYFRKYSFDGLSIDAFNVKDKCAKILPYDPVMGKPVEDSINKRIFKYTYYTEEGILLKGAVRNVSLRAETLSNFLKYLRDHHKNESECIKTFREAGRHIGSIFIFDFENKVLKRKAKIQDWIDYDSSAGMGRFLVDVRRKKIEVKNSFEAFNISSDKPVCCFLEGYFEAILSTIYNKNITVCEEECIAKGNKICTFKISFDKD